jgi:hypothetical protein
LWGMGGAAVGKPHRADGSKSAEETLYGNGLPPGNLGIDAPHWNG